LPTTASAAGKSHACALGESLYVDGRPPARDRTIAILRICGLLKCAYEWGGQAAFWGPIAEVTAAECDALAIGTATDDRWSAGESALIGAVDALEASGTWSLCNGMALPVEGWMRPGLLVPRA
jgi:hypothetical protein